MSQCRPRLLWGLAVTLVLSLAAFAGAQADSPPVSPDPVHPSDEACFACHDSPGLNLTLPSGEVLPLHVDPDEYDLSVHTALGIGCASCHPEITTYPHPEMEYATRRELSRHLFESCHTCHSDEYDETLDSMHAEVAAAGRLEAPICTDCHGNHSIRDPHFPRSLVSTTCGQCHQAINAAYTQSVHGAALIDEHNPDVPVCTDCHGVHSIQDPRTPMFRIDSPELCAGCHADPELMGRYGLSTDVYSLYSVSWHGVDVSVYRAQWPTIWHESAVCTDCHGIHDILPTHDPASRVHPDSLLTTCRQCHPDAGPNWTGAWTGHNPISLERTPFVFYTDAFYTSFAPFVLWMSAIYVLLQIVRASVARVRRSLR